MFLTSYGAISQKESYRNIFSPARPLGLYASLGRQVALFQVAILHVMGTMRGNHEWEMAIAETCESWNPLREKRICFPQALALLARFPLCLEAGHLQLRLPLPHLH